MWKFPPKKLCRRNNGRIPPNFEQTIIDRYEKCMFPIFFVSVMSQIVGSCSSLHTKTHTDCSNQHRFPIYLFLLVTQRAPPPYCRQSKWQRKQGAHPQRKTQSKAKVSRSTSNNYFFLFFWFSFTSNFSRRDEDEAEKADSLVSNPSSRRTTNNKAKEKTGRGRRSSSWWICIVVLSTADQTTKTFQIQCKWWQWWWCWQQFRSHPFHNDLHNVWW